MLSDIRTVEIDGEIWFVASDVTNILGYSNGRDAISRHCKQKGVVKHDIPRKTTGELRCEMREERCETSEEGS